MEPVARNPGMDFGLPKRSVPFPQLPDDFSAAASGGFGQLPVASIKDQASGALYKLKMPRYSDIMQPGQFDKLTNTEQAKSFTGAVGNYYDMNGVPKSFFEMHYSGVIRNEPPCKLGRCYLIQTVAIPRSCFK